MANRRFGRIGLTGAARRGRRGTFAFDMPVPAYRIRVQAVFGHLLHCGGDGGEKPGERGDDRPPAREPVA